MNPENLGHVSEDFSLRGGGRMKRMKVVPIGCVIAAAALLLCGVATLHAGANSDHKIAIHVVAHGLSCKSLPTFTECSQITTTYSGTGDVDVVPVFYGLTEYLAVEFGLTWPSEWGSCDYTKCTPTLDIGGITHPGDGMASSWTTCQSGWAVSHGYGWLNATGAGSVSVVPNPATGDYGVVDCAESPGPYYDRPDTTFAAGVGGSDGGDACSGGGRDSGEGAGQSGEIKAYYR